MCTCNTHVQEGHPHGGAGVHSRQMRVFAAHAAFCHCAPPGRLSMVVVSEAQRLCCRPRPWETSQVGTSQWGAQECPHRVCLVHNRHVPATCSCSMPAQGAVHTRCANRRGPFEGSISQLCFSPLSVLVGTARVHRHNAGRQWWDSSNGFMVFSPSSNRELQCTWSCYEAITVAIKHSTRLLTTYTKAGDTKCAI